MTETSKALRVLVTGGGSAIGGEIARQFAASERAHICDINQEHLDRIHRETSMTGTLADVSDTAAVDRLFGEVTKTLGGLDVLVNNVGMTGPMGPIEDLPTAEWERTYAVNVHSMFYCLRRGVPMLKAAGGGSIINISSTAGRMGYPFRTLFVIKWAVIGLTESLAMELGPDNISVNAICPGWIAGERHDRNINRRAPGLGVTPAELKRQIYSRISLRRPNTTADIGAMAVFLASPGGRNISGQSLSVCGNVETLAV